MTIFQSHEWEQFKLQTGYQKSYRVDGVLILQRKLPFGQTMLYSPMVSGAQVESYKVSKAESAININCHSSESWNPDKSQLDPRSWSGMTQEIRQIAKDNNTLFYRLEIAEPLTDSLAVDLKNLGFVKSKSEIQPSHTRLINLMMTEEEILTRMKPKGRYNIKIAERNNIKIDKISDPKRFYKLYEEMSKRHHLTFRSFDYFQKLFDNLAPKGYIEAFIARHDKVDLAGAVISKYDDTATYLFGGSSEEMKNLMAPYLLHFEIIKWAKVNGNTSYDLFGVSPQNKIDHKWSGVTAFKEKFGGQYLERAGSWDLIFKPVAYKLFQLVENIRGR